MELNKIISKFINTDDYSITQITEGLINSTFLLTNNNISTKYILQKINTQIFKDPETIINNHLKINALLENSNYQLEIVKPIHYHPNKYLLKNENGETWKMLNYIENSETFLNVPNTQTAYEAAKAFGYFLSIVNTKPLLNIEDALPDFINFKKRIEDYRKALKYASKNLTDSAKNEIDSINQLLFLPEKWIDMQNNGSLPKRIIHGDPKISNILFDKKGRPLAVIDLDTVTISTVLYDFGDMIRSYTNTTKEDDGDTLDNFDLELFDAVKNGFLFHLKEELTLSETENLNYAAQVVIYIQAVRFLTDYLNGSIYYSTQYPKHNLDRTKNQLTLLKGLKEYLIQ